jgi:hypothetical protein
MLPQVEAKRLALEKEGAYQEASRATSATGEAVLGCVSLWAKGDDRALSCRRVRIGHA